MTTFYKINASKLPPGKLGLLATSRWQALGLYIKKLFCIPMTFYCSLPQIEADHEIPHSLVGDSLYGFVAAFAERRLLDPVSYYAFPVCPAHKETFSRVQAAALLSKTGAVGVLVTWFDTAAGPRCAFSCTTRLRDGKYVVTFSQGDCLECPPAWEVGIGSPVLDDTYAGHQIWIADRHVRPMRVNEVRDIVCELSREYFAHNVESGLLTPLTSDCA